MKLNTYLKIFLALVCVIFLADLILALSGRDTYVLYHYPSLLYIGVAILIVGLALIAIEVIVLLVKKKWIKAVSLCGVVFLIWFSCEKVMSLLDEKSIAEARYEVELFFINKGESKDLVVDVDNDVEPLFRKYLLKNFSNEDLQLIWKSPPYGRYTFKVTLNNKQAFRVRLSTLQNEPNRLWIYK